LLFLFCAVFFTCQPTYPPRSPPPTPPPLFPTPPRFFPNPLTHHLANSFFFTSRRAVPLRGASRFCSVPPFLSASFFFPRTGCLLSRFTPAFLEEASDDSPASRPYFFVSFYVFLLCQPALPQGFVLAPPNFARCGCLARVFFFTWVPLRRCDLLGFRSGRRGTGVFSSVPGLLGSPQFSSEAPCLAFLLFFFVKGLCDWVF